MAKPISGVVSLSHLAGLVIGGLSFNSVIQADVEYYIRTDKDIYKIVKRFGYYSGSLIYE